MTDEKLEEAIKAKRAIHSLQEERNNIVDYTDGKFQVDRTYEWCRLPKDVQKKIEEHCKSEVARILADELERVNEEIEIKEKMFAEL